MMFSLFVSCPKGFEYLLEEELLALKLKVTRVSPQGVYGEGDLALIYRLCLWSRVANRVQLILLEGPSLDQLALYELCRSYPWDQLFSVDKTLAIEFHGSSSTFRNSMFGAQCIKDAIVDHFRETNGTRPTISREAPQVKLHAHLKHDVVTVSFDLTGYSLHQRGYRIESGIAPLKENVAAAMLMRAKWEQLYAEGYALHDPFCGAGTLVIEAAMIAARVAPGLLRQDQSFHYWKDHQQALWDAIREEALQQIKPLTTPLRGTDFNHDLVKAATANAARALVGEWVTFETLALNDCTSLSSKGLMICNPPYGERLGNVDQLMALYQQLGRALHAHYQGWHAAILTEKPELARAIGLRVKKQYAVFNGALACQLYLYGLDETNKLSGSHDKPLSPGAEMLLNRLKKNHQHLQKWAKREGISCYRVYDADLPDYSFAMDIYNDHVVLQEYKAPTLIDPSKVEKRRQEVIDVVPKALGILPTHVVMKQRLQQKGTEQYQKMSQTAQSLVVSEGRAKFKVNLHDYLDTGLFLDHRLLRSRFAKLPAGTQFLNCFSYTASASVHAALNGATTTNVDLSNTYVTWAKDNFKLNHLDHAKHQFIQEDCLTWLKRARERFDVIFLDPPSFSNSKRMTDTLDIQRDHEELITRAMSRLYPGGTLYFSTNLRYFVMSQRILEQYQVHEITAETIDVDFKRNQRIHHCFTLMNE
ncbi:MAG: bifunctional 23S rRNA (guanine(2069)-N(7))-methyltransferase RlmK/23S rRNA (guanine(2445)-N(2))-methyltransferase RlmL [Legionellales bacterium]|nr:bifunctional 23S rRNA (guanine(2069)-N(7))-methyltransferase RlmK/23S rRNA (guanine(2445)-N(2))-methyltransferase RlmL [Legionellales bacterium]